MTTSDAHEIAAAIRAAVPTEEQLRELTRTVADDVCDFAKVLAPVRTGEYRDSIHVEELPDIESARWEVLGGGAGLPAYRVITYDRKAWWIEFGTVKWPEHAVFAKTASHFGGTMDTTGNVPSEGGTRGEGEIGVTWFGAGSG